MDSKPALIFKTCERGNGFQVWCKLHKEYEARLAGRYQGMLTALMNPEGWKSLDDIKFAEAYLKWQGDVMQYELHKLKPLEDQVKIAVVMRHAPDQIRSFLRQQPHHIGDDYHRLDTVLNNYLVSGRGYDGSGNFVIGAQPSGRYAPSYKC